MTALTEGERELGNRNAIHMSNKSNACAEFHVLLPLTLEWWRGKGGIVIVTYARPCRLVGFCCATLSRKS